MARVTSSAGSPAQPASLLNVGSRHLLDAGGTLNGVATWEPGDLWDPGNPENRERTRELRSALRKRLLEWDPIGVDDAPEAQDEYDNYLSPLLHMLHDRRSADEVAAYLIDVVENRMGMGPVSGDAEHKLAGDLVRWWTDTTGP